MDAALEAKVQFDEDKFVSDLEQWEEAWTQQTKPFPSKPAGGALQKARNVYMRHFGADSPTILPTSAPQLQR